MLFYIGDETNSPPNGPPIIQIIHPYPLDTQTMLHSEPAHRWANNTDLPSRGYLKPSLRQLPIPLEGIHYPREGKPSLRQLAIPVEGIHYPREGKPSLRQVVSQYRGYSLPSRGSKALLIHHAPEGDRCFTKTLVPVTWTLLTRVFKPSRG